MSKTRRLQRLAQVARLYYVEGMKQSDIAELMQVSRPLISRMLQEAKDFGVVEITIHDPNEKSFSKLKQLQAMYNIVGGVLVGEEKDDIETNKMLCNSVETLLQELKTKRLGISWGHFVGNLITACEEKGTIKNSVEHVSPLLGNAAISIRNYHSDENVRIMAASMNATAHFIHLPALTGSVEEKNLLCSTEIYKQMEAEWLRCDTVLVNIGNYPSTPDFASRARYGNKLQEEKACGKLLVHYYDENGNIVEPEQDLIIQTPIEILKNCKNIVGICSANTSAKAMRGALRTGVFTHIVARTKLIEEIL